MASTVQFTPLPQEIEAPDLQIQPSDQHQDSLDRAVRMLTAALRLALVGILVFAVALRLTQSQSQSPPPDLHSQPPPLTFLLNSLTIPHFEISDGELSARWDANLTIYSEVNNSNVEIRRLDAYIWYEGKENQTLASISPVNPEESFQEERSAMEKRMNLRFKTTGWEKDQPIVDDTAIMAMAEDRKRGVTRFSLRMKVNGELNSGDWVVGFDTYPTCSDLQVRFHPPEKGVAATLVRRDSRTCSGLTQWGEIRSLL